MGQTALLLGQKYNNEPYMFFIKIGQPVLSLIQIFHKMLETEIKHELLMEIYKKSLRGQYRSDCIIF